MLKMPLFGKRFFGSKRGKDPSEQPEAIRKLKETEVLLTKKQEYLEKKIDEELLVAKKNGQANRRVALQALRRKKRYEKQLSQVDGQLSTIGFQREALENANTNTQVLQNMAEAAKAMKVAHENLDVDKIDTLMQDLTEQQELAQQISDAISSPKVFGDEVDESELLHELEQLDQEELDKELLEVGGGGGAPEDDVRLPQVPATSLPARSAKKERKEEEDEEDAMEHLQQWSMGM